MKRLNPLILLVLIASLILAACTPIESTGDAPADDTASETMTDTAEMDDEATASGDLGVVEIAAGEPIRIAYMLILSGPVVFLGEDSVGGVEIAVADRGELLGREIELVPEDSQCSAEGWPDGRTGRCRRCRFDCRRDWHELLQRRHRRAAHYQRSGHDDDLFVRHGPGADQPR